MAVAAAEAIGEDVAASEAVIAVDEAAGVGASKATVLRRKCSVGSQSLPALQTHADHATLQKWALFSTRLKAKWSAPPPTRKSPTSTPPSTSRTNPPSARSMRSSAR